MTRDSIAIVGIGCRFAGGISDPESFWRALRDGRDLLAQSPSQHDLSLRSVNGSESISRAGGMIAGIDLFDAEFFGISPREAERMDPQQRLLLEVTHEALEDAGARVHALSGSRTGVFVGLWLNDYETRMFAGDDADFHMTTGSGRYAASGRVSFSFGFQGPSLTVDTACSSSLVAVHLACQSLRAGECEQAMAGGANVILQPHISNAYGRAAMLAPDGRCKFGDARANGYVRSEGAAMVLLKPLARALADGDRIYALIAGGAVNNDGRSGDHMATPSRAGHEQMLRLAYLDAGVQPGMVDYVEAHGTGTSVGDPVEIGALGAVLSEGRSGNDNCAVGSVKTNIGHTEGAAGVAGLIKAALVLHQREIPPSLHLERPNPSIQWEELPLSIPRVATPLPPKGRPAFAGVSSFGIAGTNAHIVLREAPPMSDGLAVTDARDLVVPLSAGTFEGVRSLARSWATHLATEDTPEIRDLAYTAACRRSHHKHRLALVARDRSDLLLQLRTWLDDVEHSNVANRSGSQRKPLIVFVFPGQGSQWIGMGRELLQEEPVFSAALNECEQALRPHVKWSLNQLLTDSDAAERLENIECIQPVLVAIEIALAKLWGSWGIVPDAVIGHSMGEVAAAHVAGALSLDDAMRVVCVRSRLLQRLRGKGAMALVELTRSEAESAVAQLDGAVTVAACNGPRTTVLSGETLALEAVLDRLCERGVFCRRINVDVASHSPQVDPLVGEMMDSLSVLEPRPSSVPFHSTVSAGPLDGERLDAAYWVRNLRQPVLFSETVERSSADDATVYLEVSPHPILVPAIQQTLQHAGSTAICFGSLRRGEPERRTLLQSVGELFTAGAAVTWSRLCAPARVVSLPAYPWQRERFWYESQHRTARLSSSSDHALLGPAVQLATGGVIREGVASASTLPYLAHHRVQGRVILPAASSLEMALASAGVIGAPSDVVLEDFLFDEAVLLGDGVEWQQLQIAVTPDSAEGAAVEVFTRRGGVHSPWARCAHGRILRESGTPPRLPTPAIEAADGEFIDHYDELSRRALDYGESFRALYDVRRSGQAATANVRLSPSLLDWPGEHGQSEPHPVLLDACMQLVLATLNEYDPAGTFVPVAVQRVRVHQLPRPGSSFRARARRRGDVAGLLGDVTMFDDSDRAVLTLEGVRFRLLGDSTESLLACSSYSVVWRPQTRHGKPPKGKARWLILADESGVGAALAEALTATGDSCVMARCGSSQSTTADDEDEHVVDPSSVESFTRLLSAIPEDDLELRGVVHLWSLDSVLSDADSTSRLHTAQMRGVISTLHLVQALAKHDRAPQPQLHLVTRCAQAISDEDHATDCGHAPLWGMAAVVANELPELRCKSVDVTVAENGFDAADLAADLAAELRADDGENRVALRRGMRYVARLAPGTSAPDELPAPVATHAQRITPPYRVVTGGRTLDSLRVRPSARRVAGPGEVEIEVRATGLNFINVLSALGTYPGYENGVGPLGIECSGVISAVGPDVRNLEVGDEVVAIAFDSLATHALADARLVARKPRVMSFAESATLPIAYVTASYALEHLGHMVEGERVLIHSATGGVGLAAICLAQRAGAEVLATAGSSEKREYLRSLGIAHVFDSRSLSFADEIREASEGEGVDLVLNSLGGEAIGRGLSLLRPYGRFLEIGKRDIHAGTRLGLEPFRQHLSFFAIDLERGARERPSLIGGLLNNVMSRVERGELRPLPHRSFPISQVRNAFQLMAQAGHLGKIVIEPEESLSRAEFPSVIVGDGTYLITGGLGALGQEVARWLVTNGARHIVLLGRRGSASGVSDAIAELERGGARVIVEAANVASEIEVRGVMERIDAELPPLRGIVHAAGVLADAGVLQLDARGMWEAMHAKVLGAWVLHRLTTDRCLDFLVCFSSAAALLGIPGQANYAAGNAFLDSLAHRRRSLGLPALSISWGPWSDVGMAAERGDRGRRLASLGLGGLSPHEGIAALDSLLTQDRPHAAIMRLDATRWCKYHPPAARSRFLAELLDGDSRENSGTTPGKGVQEMVREANSPRERQSMMEHHIRNAVGRVLRLPPARVALSEPLRKQGLDSLMTLELRNRLETDLGVAISAGALWNYPTVSLLANHLLAITNLGDRGSAPAAADAATATLADAMTEDAVLLQSLLDQELAAVDELLSRE